MDVERSKPNLHAKRLRCTARNPSKEGDETVRCIVNPRNPPKEGDETAKLLYCTSFNSFLIMSSGLRNCFKALPKKKCRSSCVRVWGSRNRSMGRGGGWWAVVAEGMEMEVVN